MCQPCFPPFFSSKLFHPARTYGALLPGSVQRIAAQHYKQHLDCPSMAEYVDTLAQEVVCVDSIGLESALYLSKDSCGAAALNCRINLAMSAQRKTK